MEGERGAREKGKEEGGERGTDHLSQRSTTPPSRPSTWT